MMQRLRRSVTPLRMACQLQSVCCSVALAGPAPVQICGLLWLLRARPGQRSVGMVSVSAECHARRLHECIAHQLCPQRLHFRFSLVQLLLQCGNGRLFTGEAAW